MTRDLHEELIEIKVRLAELKQDVEELKRDLKQLTRNNRVETERIAKLEAGMRSVWTAITVLVMVLGAIVTLITMR